MESVIQWCLDNLNYWTVMLLMTIESSFIPFPSEIVVPPAAYKAAAGELNIVGVVISASFGAILGALINYGLAYWLGRPIVYKFANSKFGHLCMINQEKMEHAEEYFREHGISSTLIGRLVPAVRQLISIPAGLAKMKLHVFLLFTFLGATLWNCVLAAIGWFLHGFVSMEELPAKVAEYKPYLAAAGIALFVVFVGYLVLSSYLKKKKETAKKEEK